MNLPSTEVAERRAHTARLSALFLLLAGTAALFAAPAAQAEKPLAPLITATNPVSSEASPAISTTPAVIGEGEPETGVIISGAGPSALTRAISYASGADNPTKHPEYEIQIFTQAGCQGAPAASGTAEAFEDAGLTVGVAANALTTLSARQIDPGDPGQPSGCSSPFSYWEGNVPKTGGPSGGGGDTPGGSGGSAGSVDPSVAAKPEAPRLRLSPGGQANDNDPRVLGAAPGAASVLLFLNANCNGPPTVKASPDQLTAGLAVEVADDSTTTFSAASVGGQRSPCSDPVTYVEDSTAPRTRITMGPGVKTRKRKAVLRFTDTAGETAGTSFLCKVDRAKWKACSSPLRLKRLKPRRHVVRVRAVDAAGNAEAKGAKRGFKVVRRR